MKVSCLCGAVAYEATPPSGGLQIGLCSCLSCRKAHAAPANVYATVPRANFRWLRGQDKTSVYESSPGKNRHFCSVCGSQLIAERPAEPHVVLRVATLDEDPGSKPLIHIWRSHEVPWCAYEGDVKAFAEWPPGRA